MNQAWRTRRMPAAGRQTLHCFCGAAKRRRDIEVRRYANIVRAYQINGESRFLSTEEAL
jgi:hypothetical protein